ATDRDTNDRDQPDHGIDVARSDEHAQQCAENHKRHNTRLEEREVVTYPSFACHRRRVLHAVEICHLSFLNLADRTKRDPRRVLSSLSLSEPWTSRSAAGSRTGGTAEASSGSIPEWLHHRPTDCHRPDASYGWLPRWRRRR